jgi:hypothetical protein
MEIDPRLKDFRNALFLTWKSVGLPEPTPVQYDMADWLQSGPRRRVLMAFRGVGKSWITSAYVMHSLLLDPSRQFLVVSASKNRADEFTNFCKKLMNAVPIYQHLLPRDNQRDSAIAFDVAPAPPSHAPSVKSLGITGQLTGSRADEVILDDVEVANNSATATMRELLRERIKEVDAIIKPGGRVTFLGTPQTEESIYNTLMERGYECRIWPALYPTEQEMSAYGGRLAPMVADKWSKTAAGKPTDPDRFDEDDLQERALSYGRSGFSLQFMLNTSLSDVDRYPLRLSDLIVHGGDVEQAPERIAWGGMQDTIEDDLPAVGFKGDRYHRPQSISDKFVPYTGSVLSIDPSGRGEDETGYAVVKMLNGWMHLTAAGGLRGGYTPDNLKMLAKVARDQKVNKIIIESNFGDGMFTQLLTPYLRDTWPCTVEEVRHSTQKERRIIDTIEPVMNQHRLVVHPSVIRADYESTKGLPTEKQLAYMLFYQLTRITRDRQSLRHDDRIDALSMAVGYWAQAVAVDVDMMVRERKDRDIAKELEKHERAYSMCFGNGIDTGFNWITKNHP